MGPGGPGGIRDAALVNPVAPAVLSEVLLLLRFMPLAAALPPTAAAAPCTSRLPSAPELLVVLEGTSCLLALLLLPTLPMILPATPGEVAADAVPKLLVAATGDDTALLLWLCCPDVGVVGVVTPREEPREFILAGLLLVGGGGGPLSPSTTSMTRRCKASGVIAAYTQRWY